LLKKQLPSAAARVKLLKKKLYRRKNILVVKQLQRGCAGKKKRLFIKKITELILQKNKCL
jgi:hypothetical protein